MSTTSARLARPGRPTFQALALALPNERLLFAIIGFVGLTVGWEAASSFGLVRRSLLSSPSRILNAAIADFGSGVIWPHITTSLNEFAAGFFVAIAVGIPLGLAIGWFRRLDYLTSALLAGIYATPNVALIPLIILVAGIGLESKAIVVFLSAFFSVVVSAVAGVHSVARRHLEITRSFGGSQWLAFRSVVLPSTFPFILSGIRISAGRALVGVVSAEFLAANEGLGFYISFYGTLLDTSRVMLGIVLFGIFGIAAGELVRLAERRFEAWRPDIHR
ncbi:MAG TPA: ABC transporter permease [Candidatus Limnocylindria bacterium]|jgi:NitT/TauT family transport system permease protein|nr:ABC transporter permease [Candidatus Limnocylindria bacterium]